MKITIDIRSLSSGTVSGVENYTLNLLEHLLPLDRKNSYTLFYNSLTPMKVEVDLHFVNSQIKQTRYPNKILNSAFKSGLLWLEKLAGESDWVFMPNLNTINLKPQTKLAVTVHDISFIADPSFYDLKRNLWHKILNVKKVLNRANVIFAMSEFTKFDLTNRLGISAEKIKVVYSGLNGKHFAGNITQDALREYRNKNNIPGNFILSLGTIEPRKNLQGLIKAFEQVQSPAWLVIAGKPGWKYQNIFRQMKRSKKAAKIVYLGYIKEEEKPLLIKLSQALVYPSFYEGFGFPPLESMALGVPVVASQVTSLPEVLKDAAVYVNPHSVESIAQGIDSVLKDEVLRQQLVAKGLERVKEFNWDKSASQVLEQLNKV